MFANRLWALALASLSFMSLHRSPAAIIEEDFSTDPAARGWKAVGNTNLFSWDATNHYLSVTWDSSQTNSYFYHPLGTILGKEDDFALEFDLRLSDIATNAKSGPFEIAIGFLNLANATSSNFWRGTGSDPLHGPKNLVEFDYFPAGFYAGFGDVAPSISPTLISADNGFASGFDLVEMTTNDVFHIALNYSALSQTLRTAITRNGIAFGPVDDVPLGTNFTDFRVDTIAIDDYSDVGDDYDSVLAHGTVDNLKITLPLPPVAEVAGGFSNQVWTVQLVSSTNWLYTLERTSDFQSWTAASSTVSGNGTNLVLIETNVPAVAGFYRVRAERE
jgi:hypothetical protein